MRNGIYMQRDAKYGFIIYDACNGCMKENESYCAGIDELCSVFVLFDLFLR